MESLELKNEPINFSIQRSEQGPVISINNLTGEDFALFEQLMMSEGWKKYMQVLKAHKEGQMLALLPVENPDQALKRLGVVAGLNLSINVLPTMVAQYRARLRAELEKK